MSDQMEYARKMVYFLGETLGENYEIVLQDVPEQKIVAIANGGVSGRTEGAPLTDLAVKMIASREWETKDCKLNYFGKTKEGKVLRSSTYFIKEKDQLLGMLCINIDISRFKEAGDVLQSLAGFIKNADYGETDIEQGKEEEVRDKDVTIENFSVSLTDKISSTVEKELEQYGNIPASRLSRSEKLGIIEKLNREGVFLMKGAIGIVAQELDCAESTMYRYLSKMR